MRLFRVVSPDELADIQACGVFRQGPNSLEGKWFAELLRDALTWGTRLYGSARFHVVEVEAPDDSVDQWHRNPFLDTIGPGRYAEDSELWKIKFLGEIPIQSAGGP